MPEFKSVEVDAGIAPEWLEWMRDFQATAERLLSDDAMEARGAEEAELIGVKSALYARAISTFRTLILLVEHDRQLDLRIHSRTLIETALYLAVLDADPSVLTRMREDDAKGRRERAKLHLKAADPGSESARLLDAFLARSEGKLKYIEIGALSDIHDFPRLYASYRDVSGDSAHVTLTSLKLHVDDESGSGMTRLIVDPALDDVVLVKTLLDAGLSIVIATYMLMKCKDRTEVWDELEESVRRFRRLRDLDLGSASGAGPSANG